jgi:hypothetical protein
MRLDKLVMGQGMHNGLLGTLATCASIPMEHCDVTCLVCVVAGNVFLSRLCGARVYPVPRLPVEQLNDRCEGMIAADRNFWPEP